MLHLPRYTQTRSNLLLPIQDWVSKGVIYPVPDQPCFQSCVFTVPRLDGRPPQIIIDLSTLNGYVHAPPFTFDNHSTLGRVLVPPAYMAALDISEAYTHVPMRPNLHRYLAFSFNNQLYFFRALPFGLNVASYVLTKVLAWPLQTLQIHEVNVVAYLDDIVVWHRSPSILHQQVRLTIDRLDQMGFLVNLAKSQLEPQEGLQWLGILWHPLTGHWQASSDICEKIVSTARRLLSADRVTRRQLEALAGVVNFACQVHRHLRVFLQPLTKGSLFASAFDRDVPRRLPPSLRQALQFWVDPSVWDHVPRFYADLPHVFLWTDASRAGWGALLHPFATAHAPLGPSELVLHINTLELRAVRLAIQSFRLSSCRLLVHTDNETVRYTLSTLRTRYLVLREELLSEVVSRQIFLFPILIPTDLNVVANVLSRMEPFNTEWTLPMDAF